MSNRAVFIECNTCLFYDPNASIVTCSITYGEFPITCPLNSNHPKYGDLCKEVNKMIHRLPIVAEVLCPKINGYSDINFCADCMYYKDIEDGSVILCNYNEGGVHV